MDTRVGWEHARDSHGRVLYVNPLTREISWSLPTDDPQTGWQETTDGDGRVVDHTARRHPGRPDPKPSSYEGLGRVADPLSPPLVHNSTVAVDRGWIYWLARFSDQPCKDMELLAERSDFIGAFWLHDRLKRIGCLECSKQFMYMTVESADLAQVTWHMRNCEIHSLQDWLYAAVWIGRVDVVDWICRDKSSVNHLRVQSARRGPRKRKSLFHSVDASLVSIQECFESELMEMEAEMNVNEEAAQKGAAFSALSSIAVDLAATHGNRHILDCEPLHAASTTSTGWETLDPMSQDDYEVRVGCTVIGLYDAIINGHFEIVQWICDNQPVLSNWPKLEDGAQLLLKLLDKPTRKDMLEFFGRERGMRLDPHDLEEAVRRQDVERVRLIGELDLVESASSAVDIAAVQGNYQLLQILVREGAPLECTAQAMDGGPREATCELSNSYMHLAHPAHVGRWI
ncbi:hypothetical protein Poli38472_007077 [Pythium oligandrum]|uniref:WW domain-containing protein n=1 Tax=Pythium oligandrum TaxID=41045 RepID=A0A8K1CAL1_PYTOL|nr:hypothetical protein Poli38472_007077 [Pythium oligandrum]|eukprot:TMW58932.1 hypothetical protein Poli38472_007077 [Pythium oligandrum]